MSTTTFDPPGATRARPARYRLRNAIPQMTLPAAATDSVWLGGVNWTSPPCGRPEVRRYRNQHCTECADPPGWQQPDELKPDLCPDGPTRNHAYPFEIVMPDDCKTWTTDWDHDVKRLRRLNTIEATLDFNLARALQLGNVDDPNDPTPSLMDAVALNDTALPASIGVALLMEAAADATGQSVGYLFGSEMAAASMASAQLLLPSTTGAFDTVFGPRLVQGPGFEAAPAPKTMLDGGTPTDADKTVGESWIFLARHVDYRIESGGVRDLLPTYSNVDGSESVGDWGMLLRNEHKQLSELTAMVRVDTCGMYAVKIKSCGCC